MIYRMRTYTVVLENASEFARFFVEHLLPVQRRHGARLVGRWINEVGDRVLVVWEYDDREALDRITAAVAADREALAAQEHARRLPRLYISREEMLMESTVPLEVTVLGRATGSDAAP